MKASNSDIRRPRLGAGRKAMRQTWLLLVGALLLPFLAAGTASAQVSGTNSSYSRFGLGLLNDQSSGFNKSMGGAGLGVRIGNRINNLNPASYSSIDSLSLIFDVGMTASFGRMVQGSTTVGAKNASLDYVHAGMHIGRGLGLALGFVPYTSIGYDFSSPEQTIDRDANSTLPITGSTSYTGSGGLNQFYAGLGWKAFKNFSVGANVGFLWGGWNHLLLPVFSEGGVVSSSYNSLIKSSSASLKTYKIDLGAQYSVRLTKQDWLNIGATAGIGHKIAQDATLLIFTQNADTTTRTASSPFSLPFTFGAGAAWQHKNTLVVAADVQHEWWSKCRVPSETVGDYVPLKGYYDDRTKIAAGAQWTPDPFHKSYLKRIQYRAGFSYSTPYLKVNDMKGPMELRLTMGAGLPIMNRHNNRSVVNVGVQWLRRSASGLIKEDYFLINLGITFNERWFLKYKIE